MSVKIKGCVNVDADEFLNDFLELQDQVLFTISLSLKYCLCSFSNSLPQ